MTNKLKAVRRLFKVKRFILLFVLMQLSGFAYAGSVVAQVLDIEVHSSGRIIITFDQNISDSPDCSVADNKMYFFSNVGGGAVLISTVLNAFFSSYVVTATSIPLRCFDDGIQQLSTMSLSIR